MVRFPFSAGIEPEVVIIVSGMYCESAGKCLPWSLCRLVLAQGVILVTDRNHLLSVRNIVFVWMDLQSVGAAGILGTHLGRPRYCGWLDDSWRQTRSITLEKPFRGYEWQAVIECNGRVHHEKCRYVSTSIGCIFVLCDGGRDRFASCYCSRFSQGRTKEHFEHVVKSIGRLNNIRNMLWCIEFRANGWNTPNAVSRTMRAWARAASYVG